MSSAPAAKWFDALPTPKSVPRQLTVKELHQLLRDPERSAGVLVVDVRRADIEPPMNMMLPRAINLPAQTVAASLTSSYSHVLFHCSSSNGRGPRCAAWYQDALQERGMDVNAYVLAGGIKAWVQEFPDEVVEI
ncbi:Rhodanese-like domain-containing protein [Papiliotrema laurentii]|uniref:Rhodanese-like domain-containing protein n=1 Tax=Papiliotrema laurentii TaxID=5418 RepID=A0AAD9CWQ8_PAPLA|nr:Rhodanese-like domain-containing protein [Papiliotrema laurentii]